MLTLTLSFDEQDTSWLLAVRTGRELDHFYIQLCHNIISRQFKYTWLAIILYFYITHARFPKCFHEEMEQCNEYSLFEFCTKNTEYREDVQGYGED